MKYFVQAVLFQLLFSTILFAQKGLDIDDFTIAGFPRKEELSKAVLANNIFVRVEASAKKCFVGEPILVTYKFYTRLVAQSKVTRMPGFSGCSVQEMTTNDITSTIETLNGKKYKVNTIRKIQLTPLQSGTLILDTASVESSFTVYNEGVTEQQIKYGSALTHDETITLHSKEVFIEVNELPEKDKPTTFNGVIGNFTIGAKLSKQTDTAKENNNLKITITGFGNFANIVCPIVNWPKNVEHFEPVVSEDMNKFIFPNAGKKVFDIPFVVKEKGTIEIPAIAFVYFDNILKIYKTATTDSLKIDVKPALDKTIDETKLSQNITNKKYIWIVPVIAILAGIGWWLKFGKKQKPTPTDLIQTAEQRIEEDVTLFTATIIPTTNNTILHELSFLTSDDTAFFTKAKQLLQTTLEQPNEDSKKSSLQSLLNECNAALYGGKKIIDKDQFLELLKTLLS
jgi:hypothetical protein